MQGGADINSYNSKKLDLNLGAMVSYGTYKTRMVRKQGPRLLAFLNVPRFYFDQAAQLV